MEMVLATALLISHSLPLVFSRGQICSHTGDFLWEGMGMVKDVA